LIKAFKIFKLENDRNPKSAYEFCKSLNLEETAYYSYFNSIEHLEQEVWLQLIEPTIKQLLADETYQNYSAKEKLLAFYFTWIENLKQDRSFLLLEKNHVKKLAPSLSKIHTLKTRFTNYVNSIVVEGYATEEIKERKYISDQYKHGFWLQALFVLNFWLEDTSEQFTQTDAAIEKAVNLSFQLLSENTLDAMLDFGKFIFQNKYQNH
jgi:hypothetical protein